MKFKDHFSVQAKEYSKHRPKYPAELFDYLSSLCSAHNTAWDCATGNGQAAIGLEPYFDEIIATDGSASQIEHAEIHPKIRYRTALAESSGLDDKSVDIITVATAIHWIDLKVFNKEVRRILKPGGIIAVWVYKDSVINEEIDKIVKNYSQNIVGKYWSEENRKAEHFEKSIEFPFERIDTPVFILTENRNLGDYMNYLYTWSATQYYIKDKGSNPLELIYEEILKAWKDENSKREVKWELLMKVGRI
ncbi:MAG: class I SAM-dependent methyltransferase [Ignavibacteria bacterium]|nr:class I SAM-dependent methyltransferase [Ignavibacteria bacterium]